MLVPAARVACPAVQRWCCASYAQSSAGEEEATVEGQHGSGGVRRLTEAVSPVRREVPEV